MNYPISKREALEALQAMQKEYNNYLLKFPDKTNDRFTIQRASRINQLINFMNASDEFELQQKKEIEHLKQLVEQRERSIIQIIDTLIILDYNVAFNSLTFILEFCPDQTERLSLLRREVLRKFNIKRFNNTIKL